MLYPGHSLGWCLTQSVYSIAPADWAETKSRALGDCQFLANSIIIKLTIPSHCFLCVSAILTFPLSLSLSLSLYIYIYIYIYILYSETVCLWMTIYIYIYISLRKKTKDRLIQDYEFISILYFQFLVWTKNMKKKLIQDFFRPNG